jgi:hypothetical protein
VRHEKHGPRLVWDLPHGEAMNAFDWTHPMPAKENGEASTFRFSFDQRLLASDLRRLADLLDSDKVIAFEASTTSKVIKDGWTGTVLTVTLTGVHLKQGG